MYDYRQSRQNHRQSKRHQNRKPNRPTGRLVGSVGRGVAYALAATVLLVVSLFLLVKMLLPLLFPLERDLTIVLVPETAIAPTSIGVVTFKASSNSLVGAMIAVQDWPNPIPAGDGYLSVAEWSQSLQLVVDGVIQTPALIEMSDGTNLARALWDQLQQAQPTGWVHLPQTRWWVFVSTIPAAQQRWVEVASPSDWHRIKFQLLLGSQFTQCQVGVINTTSTSGLATRMSNFIEASGYPVVRLSDNQDNLESSIIYVNDSIPECQAEAQRLGQLLPTTAQIQADQNLARRHRAQIVLYLGQDIPQPLNQDK